MPNKRGTKSQASDKKSKSGKDVKKTADLQNSKKNCKNEKATKKEVPSTVESKMTLSSVPTASVRPQVRERRPGRPPSGKRLAMARDMPAKVRSAFRRSLDPCDNSNDSGLGFDHHADPHHINVSERLAWNAEAKRPKMDIKLEHDDVNEHYGFPETMRACKESTSLIRTAPAGSIPSLSINNNQGNSSGRAVPRCVPLSGRQQSSQPIPLITQLASFSKYASDVSLTIVKQPEQQHRARYQTEGSRGAVKDRDGNGFPIVQLIGYYQPTTLQVFIGTDVGKVAPHMFYQACKVSGKNSTPCSEKKIEGTCVIELQLDPSKEMSATCDCVGILKERNVDVEHRFPEQLGNRSKKKSTRCRMIFRTTLTHEDGSVETLQVCSQPIVCTQPPGIPEICKKSLTACPANGGLELFVLGKNFLKDTKVYFQQVGDDRHVRWEQAVAPDKEYLQQTHFVCVVPPYRRPDVTEPVTVRLSVVSSGKTSEPHQFVYTPVNGAIPSAQAPSTNQQQQHQPQFFWSNKRDQDLGMMPPPESSIIPIAPRRPSLSLPSTSDALSPPLRTLKQEYIDENSMDSLDHHTGRYRHLSESSLDAHHGDSNMSLDNSIDLMSHSNENSVEMIRSSMGRRSMCENSMDVNLSNSMSALNDETTSCTLVHPIMHSVVSSDVMDLRMKMPPIGTVADLVSSNAPSMATLQSFGVTEAFQGPLPAQSAQSIENFLTNIESKLGQESSFPRIFSCDMVAKSESAAIGEQVSSPIVTSITTLSSDNTERLDQLVNSTVESHMLTPAPPKDVSVGLLMAPEAILNAQMVPLVGAGEPEKAVLLKAACDLLETQKKIVEMEAQNKLENNKIMNEIMTMATSGTSEVMPTSRMSQIGGAKDYVIPVTVKEMQVGQDKKNEDTMIPQAFTALTENELINLINPSCFDQGNGSNYP